MVIPWVGFPLAKLLEKVEPNSQANYRRVPDVVDPQRMPNQRTSVLDGLMSRVCGSTRRCIP